MRLSNKFPIVMLLAVSAVSALPAALVAQSAPAHQDSSLPELAFGYSYVHSNPPPGGCGLRVPKSSSVRAEIRAKSRATRAELYRIDRITCRLPSCKLLKLRLEADSIPTASTKENQKSREIARSRSGAAAWRFVVLARSPGCCSFINCLSARGESRGIEIVARALWAV